jgi:hypothetical protein
MGITIKKLNLQEEVFSSLIKEGLENIPQSFWPENIGKKAAIINGDGLPDIGDVVTGVEYVDACSTTLTLIFRSGKTFVGHVTTEEVLAKARKDESFRKSLIENLHKESL